MRYYVIIPAHNEADFIYKTLDSLVNQSLLPEKVIVVNDHSTDATASIIDEFTAQHCFIDKRTAESSDQHMPGSKVINAFNKGLEELDDDYDFIVKLDADLILPENYFSQIAQAFARDPKIGMAGGFAYEEDHKGNWKLNHPMGKDHIRGAFKAYTNSCFKAIGGLRPAMGWDTLDELLARHQGYRICSISSLKVKHLRPTGKSYNKKARLLQGKAMYTMGYGFLITLIASLKMALKSKNPKVLLDNLQGFFKAKSDQIPLLVNKEQARFIRNYRWKNIRAQLGLR